MKKISIGSILAGLLGVSLCGCAQGIAGNSMASNQATKTRYIFDPTPLPNYDHAPIPNGDYGTWTGELPH